LRQCPGVNDEIKITYIDRFNHLLESVDDEYKKYNLSEDFDSV
jgi:hypothetical protein